MWPSLQVEQAQVFRRRVICVWFCGRTSSVWLDNNTTFSNYRSTSPQPGLNNHNPLPLGICLREALPLIWTLKPQTTPFSMMDWQKAEMNVVDLKGPFSGGLLVEGKNFSLFPNSSLPPSHLWCPPQFSGQHRFYPAPSQPHWLPSEFAPKLPLFTSGLDNCFVLAFCAQEYGSFPAVPQLKHHILGPEADNYFFPAIVSLYFASQ